MRLIDRRLGLIFCFFVLALQRRARPRRLAAGRPRRRAPRRRPQPAGRPPSTVPGERGRVLDRNGKVLAVSEDAATVIATPYQVEDPADTARRLAEVLPVTESEIAEALSDRESGFAYLAKKVDLDEAERVEALEIEGIATLPDSRRLYPQGELAAQVIGAVGSRERGPDRARAVRGRDARRRERRARRSSTTRAATRSASTPSRPPSVGDDIQLTIDAAIQDATEEALAEAGEHYEADGRDRGRDEPATPATCWRWRTGPGTTPPTSTSAERGGARQPRDRLHLRARLDLQGLHRRGGARGGPGHAEHAASTFPRRSRSPTARSRRRTRGRRSTPPSPRSSPSPPTSARS